MSILKSTFSLFWMPFQNYDAEVCIEANFLKIIESHERMSSDFSNMPTFTTLDASYDFFFSIGGDGTILKSVTFVRDLGIPIVGINSGRLGFFGHYSEGKCKPKHP